MSQILIIEDDFLFRKILRNILQAQGYEVIESANGSEALSKLSFVSPALILCDWDLPELDGLAVCRLVKADPRLSNIYFILLTSYNTVKHQVQGLDSGADDFLTKPIDVTKLGARIRAGLRVHKALEEQRRLTRVLESEISEAADYLTSLLPPPMSGVVDFNSKFLPSRQLGGDCFDYRWLDQDWVVMYLLDVSGHGLGAALLSASIQNILKSQVLPNVNFYQPGLVLTALNEAFSIEDSDRYFTIWYGVYDRQRRSLFYSSAGHPPALLFSGGNDEHQPCRLGVPAVPIGMMPETRYTSQSCKIEPNSTLYLFSDGVYEIQRPDGTMWNLEDWISFLRIHYDDTGSLTPDQIIKGIQKAANIQEFEDDCSLLQVRFK